MHKIPERTTMICQLFRKGERFANQSTTTLPQRVIEPLDMAGLATLLARGSMALGPKNRGICLPEIRVTHRTLAVNSRKCSPQLVCRHFGSCSNRHTDNFARIPIDRQPNPLLTTLLTDK
jgi:hypothetical protein